MTSVFLAEEPGFLLDGLRAVVAQCPGLVVVGEAADEPTVTERCLRLRPDLLLVDLALPRMDGVSSLARIRKALPGVRLVALSSHREGDYAKAALEAGATGYFLKDASTDELVHALGCVLRGEVYVSPGVDGRGLAEYLRTHNAAGYRRALGQLTRREQEVFHLVVEGHRNKDMAEKLFVSIKTVEKHKSNVFRKLGVSCADELCRLWRRGVFGP